MVEHTLIVGGTGMLRPVSVALSRHSRVMTSVARTARSLRALDAQIDASCVHHLLELDWQRRGDFVRALERHVHACGPPERVLLWLHDDAFAAAVAECVIVPGHTCDLFQVRGSAAAKPGAQDASLDAAFARFADIRYHRIVLGFQHEAGDSRWLRNDEIAEGVLAAITRADAHAVVGTVEPWHLHP